MVHLMIEFSVFDLSKIIVFHITEKSGYLSVFDPSKKGEKPSKKLGQSTKKLGFLSPTTYEKDDPK